MLCVKGYEEEFNGEEMLKSHNFYCDFKDEGRVPCQLCEDMDYGLKGKVSVRACMLGSLIFMTCTDH